VTIDVVDGAPIICASKGLASDVGKSRRAIGMQLLLVTNASSTEDTVPTHMGQKRPVLMGRTQKNTEGTARH
jgi:hypothetical protein